MEFSSPLALGPTFTMEFWAKPDSLSEVGNIFSGMETYIGGDGNLHYNKIIFLSLNSLGQLNTLTAEGDCGSYSYFSPTGVIFAEEWQHVAVVGNLNIDSRYGPIGEYNLFYVNGALVSSNFVGMSFCGLPFPWSQMTTNFLGQSQFAGDIGEFRIWNRDLSQSEIQIKMTQVLNPTNETGLVGYWRFTEGTSNIVYDLAGTNNGIIYGAVWSSDLPNTALQPPSISQQPVDQTVFLNGNAIFNVEVVGSTPLFYQWMFDGTNLAGTILNSLTVTNASLQNLGAYSVVVTNGLGAVTSSNAALLMEPFLESPFTGTIVNWGQDADLTVTPAGTGPFFYQWYASGVAINGATNQTFTISSIQFTNAGFYLVVVSSALGSVTNAPAQVIVNPAGYSLGIYPGITITGTVGYAYSIQSTPSLSNTNGWTTIANLTLQATQQLWFDSSINAFNPSNPQRFYRIVPQP